MCVTYLYVKERRRNEMDKFGHIKKSKIVFKDL